MMNKFSLTLISLVALLVLSGSLIAGPELKIVNDEFDLGMIAQNSTAIHYFMFKSVGDEPLVIEKIKTGCSCVLMPLERDTLPPGDSMLVGMEWDIGKNIFKTRRYPYIYTNAKKDAYRCGLTAEVHKQLDKANPISAKPFKADFSKFNEIETTEIKIELTNNFPKDLTITIISHPVKECEIYFPDKIRTKTTAIATLKVKKEYLDKEFKSSVTLAFNDKSNTHLTIPIKRKIFK